MENHISSKKLREFGLLFGFCLPLFFGWLFPLFTGHNFRVWTIFLGSFFISLGFIKPNLLIYPYKIWIKFGNFLGWINSKIILGLIFVLILLPIACLMRLFNHDPLRQNIKNNVVSYKESKINHSIDLTRIF